MKKDNNSPIEPAKDKKPETEKTDVVESKETVTENSDSTEDNDDYVVVESGLGIDE